MDKNLNSCGQNISPYDSHLDFVTYWADQTVEQEIIRGHQLREVKPHAFPKREYDVINIDYIKPPRSVKKNSYRRKRRHESSCNYSQCRGSTTTPAKWEVRQRKYRKQNKKRSPCGMRIAELAVPTKRQCLDAWRNNYDKLPAQMVDRLRQYVLDQRPVVAIADAVYCFKGRKCVKKEKSQKTAEKPFGRPRLKPLRENEIKVLSAIFGHKIAKKLNIPLEIKLNDELQKIANVVSLDILNLMRKSKKVDTGNNLYKAMHTDVTKKITIWISDVLEETSYNILEEQYKDFEEEVGPVLDLIEELVEIVLNICEPEPSLVEESSSSESEGSAMEEKIEEGLILDEIIGDNIEYQVQNELISIIDNIFKDEGLDMSSEAEELPNDADNKELESEHDVYMDVETDADLQQSEFVDASDDFENNFETNDDVNETLNEENETAPEEEAVIVEDDSKKVKFNDGDEETNSLIGDDLAEQTDGGVSANRSIEFASPNEDLLSDADESWPAEIQQPLLIPSQSASKSILSLGKIVEDEEKAFSLEDDGNEIERSSALNNFVHEELPEITTVEDAPSPVIERNQTKEQVIEEATPNEEYIHKEEDIPKENAVPNEEEDIPKVEKALPKEKEVIPKEEAVPREDEIISKIPGIGIKGKKHDTSKGRKNFKERPGSKEKTSSSAGRTSLILENNLSKTAKKLKPKPKPKPEKIKPGPISTIHKLSKTVGKRKESLSKDKKIDGTGTSQSAKDLSEHEGKETTTNIKFSSLRVKQKQQRYKVNVDAAPSWVTKSYGEPNCVCIDIQAKTKQSPNINYNKDIRKWCRDLENGYENLKLWNEWIDTTSRTINKLQNEIGGLVYPERCSNKHVCRLLELKTNIDKDACLWRRLRKSTQDRLNSYRKIYRMHRAKDCNKSLPY